MHLFGAEALEQLFFSSALPGRETRARPARREAISGFDLVFLESVKALEGSQGGKWASIRSW